MQRSLSPTQGSATAHAPEVLRALGLVRMTMRHILLATDGSDGACGAADVAADLAIAMGAKLSILTVVRNPPADKIAAPAQDQRNMEISVEAKQILESAQKRAQRAGVSDIRVQLGRGEPVAVIIESARQQHVEAIAIGRRGRGLVSQKVVPQPRRCGTINSIEPKIVPERLGQTSFARHVLRRDVTICAMAKVRR
jgi:nucleotide-binding universal stress UspA family protein